VPPCRRLRPIRAYVRLPGLSIQRATAAGGATPHERRARLDRAACGHTPHAGSPRPLSACGVARNRECEHTFYGGDGDQHPSARWNLRKRVWRCDVCDDGGGYVDLARRLDLVAAGSEWPAAGAWGDGRAGGATPAAGPPSAPRRIAATYDYHEPDGEAAFQVVRFEPKGFAQRRPDGSGGWRWGLGDLVPLLYRLPAVLAADGAEPIFLCEGEKDADRLAALGLTATTSPMGAGHWRAAYDAWLIDRAVVILPDNDEAGLSHAVQVAQALDGVAASVRVARLPDLPPKGDVSDWLDAGGAPETLRWLAGAGPAWPASFTLAGGEFLVATATASVEAVRPRARAERRPWPTLRPAAFHGLAGEIVRALAPQTEADPAALLVGVLLSFGNVVGRGPHARVGATRHGLNEFAVVVGETARARKDTARGEVRALFAPIDPRWAAERQAGGLSSGEGFIAAVRDPAPLPATDRARGGAAAVMLDPGAADKRLLVDESEFATVLKVC
jgi:hypothetical protein